MQSIGDGCYRVMPVIIEDDDVAWDQVLKTLDRWGDRMVPKAPLDQWPYLRGEASL